MLAPLEHRYVAEILREGAEPVTTAELRLDWIPAIEWGHFQRLRKTDAVRGVVPGPARIWPAWDRAAGAPYVSHLNVSFEQPGKHAEGIPLQFFSNAVQHAVGRLVEDGRIREGDNYHWRICAYRAAHAAAPVPSKEPFQVEEATNGAPVPDVRALSQLLAQAQHHGPRSTDPAHPDITVLFAPKVLREAATTAMAAGTLESGGILLGKLSRDSATRDLALQVTAQIPAREAIADDASLRFTADTWKAVDAAIGLRRASEEIVGWWHSHPAALWPCRNCPPERRAVCTSNRAFFSTMDVAFHRTAFQRAHNIALLLSFHDDPAPRFDLFGWHRGMVCGRGYYTTEVHS